MILRLFLPVDRTVSADYQIHDSYRNIAVMAGIFTIDAIKKIRRCKPLQRTAARLMICQRFSLFKTKL